MYSPKRRGGSVNPQPSLMSKEQMADYLHDLRTNRPVRPQVPIGSRPYPSSSARQSALRDYGSCVSLPRLSYSSSGSDKNVLETRSSSSLSHRQSLNLSISTRSSVDDRRPSEYFERSERQKEFTEARDVRLAMEQIDHDAEQSVISAAREEADELIRTHKKSGTPYRITPPLETGPGHEEAPVLDIVKAQETQVLTDNTSSRLDLDALSDALPTIKKRSSYSKLAEYWSNSGLANRRRSSGSRRSVSGKQKGIFVNPDDKIYEDPVERLPPPSAVKTQISSAEPVHARRNPFARTRSVKQTLINPSNLVKPEQMAQERTELQNDPLHRHHNDGTTSDVAGPRKASSSKMTEEFEDDGIKYKNGIEVRGADLRAATSMRFKDRSTKLPSPTAVSDSPSRPIVSFKPDWTQPETDDRTQATRSRRPSPTPRIPDSVMMPEPVKSASAPAVPTIRNSTPPNIQINNGRMSPIINGPRHPGPDYKVPAPCITISSPRESRIDPVPFVPSKNPARYQIPSSPSIVVEDLHKTRDYEQPIRDTETKKSPSYRYSAFPKPRPSPTHSATTPIGTKPPWAASAHRSTALCAQCALPISGKIVSAAGLRFHPACFTCYHCGEGLECVDFYPEPAEMRAGRIDRIQQRLNGEIVEETEGATQADDGDDSLRFYCHLDFHEFFSPRCNSCKTPIEGEVIVACGAEWHVGHFFCAECGDPFDQTTPFIEKDGYAWCVECHTNRYSAKCKKCKRPVVTMVVQALGSEWHSECFCCTTCSGTFGDGRFFLRSGSQDPVCMACEEKRLKA